MLISFWKDEGCKKNLTPVRQAAKKIAEGNKRESAPGSSGPSLLSFLTALRLGVRSLLSPPHPPGAERSFEDVHDAGVNQGSAARRVFAEETTEKVGRGSN
jgi:hypothetical protein